MQFVIMRKKVIKRKKSFNRINNLAAMSILVYTALDFDTGPHYSYIQKRGYLYSSIIIV